MIHDISAILQLEVPVIVRLGERQMTLQEVVNLVPGGIIELPKSSEAELDLLVNNKQIGVGSAVKVGENFGIQITYIGDVRSRIEALGAGLAAMVENHANPTTSPSTPGVTGQTGSASASETPATAATSSTAAQTPTATAAAAPSTSS